MAVSAQGRGRGCWRWCFYGNRGENMPRSVPPPPAAVALSIRINVLGFPNSAMFSCDAFSDQSAIIFHAPAVTLYRHRSRRYFSMYFSDTYLFFTDSRCFPRFPPNNTCEMYRITHGYTYV